VEAFKRHFQGWEAFLNKYEDFIKKTRLFEDISREMKTSVYKCVAFIKISIIFEDFFRKIEGFSIIARLIK
jgi:hypothetical protein